MLGIPFDMLIRAAGVVICWLAGCGLIVLYLDRITQPRHEDTDSDPFDTITIGG